MLKSNMIDRSFWAGKRVFLTGHTGFKGSWMCLWLNHLGARVTGYSLPAPTFPSLFEQGDIERTIEKSIIGDITDLGMIKRSLDESNPEIIIHMAAQSLVRASYEDPVQTYYTNVIGTVNIMEAARSCSSVRVILNVTTDKCYENQEWHWGYRENEALGGFDPYSSSKACSELITSSYRRSFLDSANIQVATARAGNVIGGGDWATDRLIPDLIRALSKGEKIHIRNPNAVRPWQHVLEPLSGYLLLCQRLFSEGKQFAQAWNFGPRDSDVQHVEWIVKRILKQWPELHPGYQIINQDSKHEASMLKLDCSKALMELGWSSKWSLDKALEATLGWYLRFLRGEDIKAICAQQIAEYESNII